MQQLITILHILVAISVIALVLLQRGKGAEVGAGFGSGASNTMFGSQGSTPFLVKLTGILALVFFITSGVLSFIVGKNIPVGSTISLPTTTRSAPLIPTSTPEVVVPPQNTLPADHTTTK